MDAAGKDGAIKHVMSGVNPQGCQVRSFKAPSHEELDHDFLWRAHKAACRSAGGSAIFNRSYYEEVLVVRVHPELLAAERLPEPLVGKHIWDERYEDINAYERYLARNGMVIRKFFLHLSKEEQRKRFLARLDEPAKNWKFSLGDIAGAEVLGRLPGRLRGDDAPDRDQARPVVRGAGRPQVVHAPGGGRGHRGRRSPGSTSRSPKRIERSGKSWRRSGRRSSSLEEGGHHAGGRLRLLEVRRVAGPGTTSIRASWRRPANSLA